jgi:hypothetical protein
MIAAITFVSLGLAYYSGAFVFGFGFRAADHLFSKRDPEAVSRWNNDRRYVRLMMGRKTI